MSYSLSLRLPFSSGFLDQNCRTLLTQDLGHMASDIAGAAGDKDPLQHIRPIDLVFAH